MGLTCRVYESQPGQIEAIPGGVREYRQAAVVGDAGEPILPIVVSFSVDILHTDSLTATRAKLVDAAVQAVAGAGYNIARNRVICVDFSRGS